ncbi:hypothetical protein C7B69_02215 [filamentous cyanobacterium Phorm 46]|nr:hypothetical protein C7B69_02215 [filamentous cyanobacterium Phorm 46]PSB43066.1 hypothetical protein C7B67_24390 [filamentous cyanobacterium Phorm 6]
MPPATNFRRDTPEHINSQKTNFLNLIEVLNEVKRFRNPILSFPIAFNPKSQIVSVKFKNLFSPKAQSLRLMFKK